MDRLSVIDDFPYLDAALITLPFFLNEFLFVRASTSELIIEGVKVDGQDAVLGPVPGHFR